LAKVTYGAAFRVAEKGIFWYNMMMNQKITEIQKLLRRNLFLSEDKKKAVLKKLKSSADEAILKVLTVLQNADQIQNKLLQKAAKKNPDFLKDIQRTISGQKKIQIHEDEAEDRAHESDELSALEEEFENIFS
jgi:hypothetical protein